MIYRTNLFLYFIVNLGIILFVSSCGDSINSLGSDTDIQDVSLRPCKNNAQCNSDEECKNNYCVKKGTVACRNNSDCNPDQDCINGKCVDILTDAGVDGGDEIGDVIIVKKGKISADPMTIEFGAMRFGEKRERTFRVKNVGNADLKILKIMLDEKTDSNTFGFMTDFSFGSYLAPNGEFEVTVYCQQNDELVDTGDLLISSDDDETPILRIKMKNSYKDKPDIALKYLNDKNEEVIYPEPDGKSPTNEVTINIGNVPLGEKKQQIITVLNASEESIVKITEIKYDIYNNSKTNINEFNAQLKDTLEGNEISLPVYLSPSDSVILIVKYAADSEALDDKYSISLKSNDLDVNNDGDDKEGGLLIINLTAMAGYREPELAVLDLNDKDILSVGIDFGEVEKGISSKRVFKICNKGGGTLIIDKASGVVNGNFTLNPSSLEASLKYNQCITNIEVEFKPSVVGEIRDVLRIISNDPLKPVSELNLRGLGINSEIRVHPQFIDFGDVLVNSVSSVGNIEVKNIGDGSLFIYNIELGAGSSKDFSLINLPNNYPVRLKYNESITFGVNFKPTTLGVKNGAILISSSDAENLLLQIPLTGNGSNCDISHADCNNDPADGCETDITSDVNNCGGCGFICSLQNANPICENSKCSIESCRGTFQDCNNDSSDGCESDKLYDKLNCGGCANVCGDRSYCVNGGCICEVGYLNCDGNFATNGCEVDKNMDPLHCGDCNTNCGVNSVCNSGFCGCQQDYKDCDQKLDTGCEVNIKTNPNHCGDCYFKCGANAYCNEGICACNSGYGNCNGDWFDGCEKYLMFDKYNCGMCGKICSNLPNSTTYCEGGQCKFTCLTGYEDCDGIIDNGCESLLNSDPNNCGVCGNKCGANMECVSGICKCKSGFADCNPNIDGCETNITSDSNNCGACNNKCNNNAYCSSSVCVCNTHYGNCNNDWGDGCEIYLPNDVYNCGSCGKNCYALPNVVAASCNNYLCKIDDCAQHTANCDSNVDNGCEVNHNSYANACATAVNGGELCGDDGTPVLGPFEGIGSKWFKFKVKECDSGFWADTLAALFYLDVPDAPQDYELVIYWSCGVLGGSFPKDPGIDESILVTKDDVQCWPSSCDDTFDVYVEIKYIGGGTNQCSKWYLTVSSQDNWYN